MYEEIMKSTRNSFFALLNIVFPEKKRGTDHPYLSDARNIMGEFDVNNDNEWMQEYYIIYNSYILEGKEY